MVAIHYVCACPIKQVLEEVKTSSTNGDSMKIFLVEKVDKTPSMISKLSKVFFPKTSFSRLKESPKVRGAKNGGTVTYKANLGMGFPLHKP